jgi:hypothetical protein
MSLTAAIFSMLLALGAIALHAIDVARVSSVTVRKPWTKRVAITRRRSA